MWGPTDFRCWTKNHNEARNTGVITSKLSLERWKVCDLSEGVSQVTVNDPVIQMFLLIKKFTYLVAEKTMRENILNLWQQDTYRWTKKVQSVSSYAQFGFLSQHQQPLFIKLDHTPNVQQLQQNLHRTRRFLLTSTGHILIEKKKKIATPEEVCVCTCCLSVWRESSSGQHRNSRTCWIMCQTFMGHLYRPKQEFSFMSSWKFGSSFK